MDAALIAAAQRVEHYEIAGYGTVCAYADLLGESRACRLLRQTLEEEKETDQKLTELSKEINVEAKQMGPNPWRESLTRDGWHRDHRPSFYRVAPERVLP